jgi:O-antigen/teichoic acid export membrane protein
MLTAAVLRGLTWSGVGQTGLRLLQAGLSLVLARLLAPSDFGLLGMALILVGVLQVLVSLGLPTVVVRRRLMDSISLANAFWITTGMGALFSIVLVMGGPLAGRLFASPIVGEVVQWMAPSLVLAGLGAIPTACLTRDMDFRALALLGLAGTFVGGALAIGLAIGGQGVWALVVGHVASIGVAALLALVRTDCWRGRAGRTGQEAALLREAAPYTGFDVLNYSATFVDNVAVGRFLGAPALGVYALAYSLATLPQTWLVGLIARVTLPAYAHIREDPERLRRAYLRTLQMVGLVSFPLLVGLGLLASEVILLLYGPAWAGAAPILSVLALLGIATAIMALAGGVLVARDCGRVMFWWSVWTLVLLVIAVGIGVPFGVMGVATAVTVRAWVMLPVLQWIVGRALALPGRVMVGALIPALASSIGMGVTLTAVRIFWGGPVAPLPFLAVSVPVGAAAYLGCLGGLYPSVWRECGSLARQVFHSSHPKPPMPTVPLS